MQAVSVDVARPHGDDSGRWVTATLDAVAATLLRLQSDLPQDARMSEVFEAIRPVLYRLCAFEVMAFVSMDDDGLGFSVEAIDDWSLQPSVVTEVEHHVREGAFAWSLYQNRPVILRGGPLGRWVVLHSLATPSKVIGMFLAVLPAEAPYLPDVAHKALSIVLMSCSSVLESGALYRKISEHNARLEDIVAERTLELRRSEKAAHRANRVKSEFLANMSHEMRTPLNGITGMASLLETTPLDEDQREQVSTIVRSSEHLVQLISDLLDSAKAEAGQLDLENVWFDLREVLEDVLELLAPRAGEHRVEVVLDYGAGVPARLRGDPGRVRQIITNLVGNAVKFTAEGEIVVHVSDDGDGLLTIAVTDSGIGIDPEHVERIFDAFAQADSSTTRRFGGTGLGLSIGRTLARLMNGDLHVTSEVGVGSTFSLVFAPTAIDHDERPASVLGGEVVLMVSGRDVLTDALSAMVTNAGGTLTTSRGTSGEAPIDQWMSTSWSRRTVVVDCSWDGPVWAGFAEALRAHEELATTRVIGLLPPGDRRLGERLKASGFDHCLARPIRERRLVAAIRGTRTTSGKASDGARPLAPATILVADDNPVNVAVARKMIQTLGGEARTVTNGREAVEALEKESFDVVLMDIQMPVMDGYAATAAIRATGSSVPIVALTASDRVADRERSLASGMDHHLAKPLTVTALREALSRWIADPSSPEADVGAVAPEASAPAAGPAFDWVAALERTGGDREVLVEVSELFIEMWPELMTGLESAAAAGDSTQLAAIAHRIKGASLNLGAQRVADAASRAEDAWSLGDLGGTTDRITSLREGFDAFRDAAEHFRRGGHDG